MMKACLLVVILAVSVLGSPTIERESRIVNGNTAAAGQFPHSVSLRTPAGAHFCGGVIISNQWILSVAHCTINRTPANTFGVVGTNNRFTGGTNHAISHIINHPLYTNIFNDVCVLRTVLPIVFNALVNQVGIGSANVGAGSSVVVAGWGNTQWQGQLAENLQYLHATTILNPDCASRFAGTTGNNVQDNMLCRMATVTGSGTCQGDSGSGTYLGGNVVGLVSWGVGCAFGTPDVDARVSSFHSWILDSMASVSV